MVLHGAIPALTLRDLPSMPSPPKVGDLLPEFVVWPNDVSKVLELSAYEKKCFEECGGLSGQLIDKNVPLRTILHCMGTQLEACPCGCRGGPLSLDRLRSEGLFGALVLLPSPQTSALHQSRLRHAHPWELAVLNGVCPEGFDSQLKLALTGLGQIASPLQVTWVVAQVQSHLQKHGLLDDHSPIEPEQVLWKQMQKLFRARDHKLPMLAHHPLAMAFKSMCAKVLSSGNCPIGPDPPAPNELTASAHSQQHSVTGEHAWHSQQR